MPIGENLVDGKLLERLTWYVEPEEPEAALVAKMASLYLSQPLRDRRNSYTHSHRWHLFRWLLKVPRTAYGAARQALLSAALKLAERDMWESCNFAAVFAQQGDYQAEAQTLRRAGDYVPNEMRYKHTRDKLHNLAILAEANGCIQANELEKANLLFNTVKERES